MATRIKLIECPRDAWQALPGIVPTETKVAYLRTLISAGFKHLDAVSFVSPKAVPQMVDSEEVLKLLDPPDDVEMIGIVVNEKGADRAIATEAVRTLGFPYSISPTFLEKNQHQTPEQALDILEAIAGKADKAGLEVVVYISMAFGNPYGDFWDAGEVVEAVGIIEQMNITSISLADTVGLAKSELIGEVAGVVSQKYDYLDIGVHLHSRPEQAEEKIVSAYNAGVRRFDSAIGGLGGCPFAQDALVGNIPTEKVLESLSAAGRGSSDSQAAGFGDPHQRRHCGAVRKAGRVTWLQKKRKICDHRFRKAPAIVQFLIPEYPYKSLAGDPVIFMAATTMAYETILLEYNDSVATLTLNRPEKRNALSFQLIGELMRALDEVEQSQARALILTGAGKAFCSGMDLAELRSLLGKSPEQHLEDSSHAARLFRRIFDFPKPTIAAVNGAAIAGGTGVATMCDFTLAAPEAKFGYTEVRIGFVPAVVASILVWQVGHKIARDLLLTGRLFGAEEALRLGLVNEVVAADNLMGRARELAGVLLESSPSSLRATKKLLAGFLNETLDEQLAEAMRQNAAIRTTHDFREGITAFLEKRKPRWTGN